jgi:predicted acylesterase/phospholipase RssA
MNATYFSKICNILIDNLPNEYRLSTSPLELDLVLDGGVFNGSYLIGALLLLKEMEKCNYIKVKRISGCSIGSLAGLLYFIDSLDIIYIFYDEMVNHFKKTYKSITTENNICTKPHRKHMQTFKNK